MAHEILATKTSFYGLDIQSGTYQNYDEGKGDSAPQVQVLDEDRVVPDSIVIPSLDDDHEVRTPHRSIRSKPPAAEIGAILFRKRILVVIVLIVSIGCVCVRRREQPFAIRKLHWIFTCGVFWVNQDGIFVWLVLAAISGRIWIPTANDDDVLPLVAQDRGTERCTGDNCSRDYTQ